MVLKKEDLNNRRREIWGLWIQPIVDNAGKFGVAFSALVGIYRICTLDISSRTPVPLKISASQAIAWGVDFCKANSSTPPHCNVSSYILRGWMGDVRIANVVVS